MKKYQLDLIVVDNVMVGNSSTLLTLTHSEPLPEMIAGQFAELQVDKAKVLLRRPISIHNVDKTTNTVEFLIQIVGEGTKELANLKKGDSLNVLLPLGNGFGYAGTTQSPLLIGGGVGVAPLLHLGKELKSRGITPTFLFGGRSKEHLLRLESFEAVGKVYVTTEDASLGEKGFVTNHSILNKEQFDLIATCGPKPMMKAVAAWARTANCECEVSLENMMACGVGACLCCVEKDGEGHNVCVCKEGPVFNSKKLNW
jgi:dihydroorotate dehydrogenase electron transfer subunit